MHLPINTYSKLLLSVLIPILAALVQWEFWPVVAPKTWIFLYPAVFLSASIGGLVGGLIATCLTTVLGIYFFIDPQQTWKVGDAANYISIAIFILMGIWVSATFARFFNISRKLDRHHKLAYDAQQDRLNLALNAANAGIWEWDLATNENSWTDNLWSLYGLEKNSCQPSYESWLTSVHSDDQAAVQQAIDCAVRNHSEMNLDWRVAKPIKGKERWLMARGQPGMDARGGLAFYRGIVLDVSERRAMIKQLEDDEALLSFAMETMNAGVWKLDLITNVATRTLRHDQIFGYATLLPEWTYEMALGHVLREDRKIFEDSFQKARENQTDWQFECRIRQVNGSIRWISAKGGHIFDGFGKPTALVGIVQDITERKEAEARLRFEESRYRAFVDQAAPDAMFVHDQEGHFIEVNRRACLSTGYSKEELLAMNVVDLEQDFDLPRAQALWSRIKPGESHSIKGHHRHKDGHIFPVELNFGLLVYEGRRLYLGLVRDITERNKLEHALQEKERLLADSQAIAQIGSWMFDINSGNLRWSDETFRLYGLYLEADQAPDWDQFLSLLHPDDRSAMTTWCEDCLAGKQPGELVIRTNLIKGQYRWLLGIGKLERGADGKPVRMIGTVQDITQKLHAEKAEKESSARIQAILATVADGIITINDKAIVESFNPAAELIFGYPAPEVIGQNIKMLMPESYASQSDNFLKRYLATNEAKIIGIGRIVEGRRKNATTFPLELAVSEMYLGTERKFTGVVRDITERKTAEDKLKAALNEKELLLKEVYHRVKNNLQIVSSLINLQIRSVKNEEAANLLKQSVDRIKAMSLLHERLYQSKDLANIEFNEYICSLAENLLQGSGISPSKIKLNIAIDQIHLDVDTAIPCGLIINELLTNALHHAFPEGQQGGEISISFIQEEAKFLLIVSDNGIGFPDDFNFNAAKSLGFQLVNSLTNQLLGKISIDHSEGSKFTIQFSNRM
jgi:PAS domain S-box-containing protein